MVCSNPGRAGRDAAIRARLAAQLEDLIKDTGTLTAADRARLEGSLAGKPGLKRLLRLTPGLSPPGGPDPRSRHLVLARVPADPVGFQNGA
jgi:hypothetical protein